MIRVMLTDGELRRYSFMQAIKYLVVRGEHAYFDNARYHHDHPESHVIGFLIKYKRLSKLQQRLIHLHRTRVFCSLTIQPYPFESNLIKLGVLRALDRLPKPVSWPIEYYESTEHQGHSTTRIFSGSGIPLFNRNFLGQ